MFFLPSLYRLCLLFHLFDQKEMVVLWLIVDPHVPYELYVLFYLFVLTSNHSRTFPTSLLKILPHNSEDITNHFACAFQA